MVKNCLHCGKVLTALKVKLHSKYCCNECRRLAYQSKYHELNPDSDSRNRNFLGAISEMKATVDLLSRGYEVFRSINPGSSCDLAILFNHTLIRVEVTTASYAPTGNNRIIFPAHKAANFDILALVLHDKIIYKPELPKLLQVKQQKTGA